MKLKKILILVICIALSICCCACKKIDSNISSDYSSTIYTSQINSDLNVSDTVSTPDTSSVDTSSSQSSQNNVSSSNNSKDAVNLEEKYGFNSLESVEYKCISDIPGGDAIYEITAILTDKGNSISYMGVISCAEKDISIDGLIVTIPYEYRQKHSSVKLTAKHRFADVSCDFTINFNKWQLIFEDNFDGTELNTDIWNIWDSADWQYFYSPESMFLDGNGHLINRVSILEAPDSEYGYTRKSGAITTKDKYEHTYGYFEISMKPHRTNGIMGAFWIMAGDMGDKDAVDDNSSVNGVEIDVVETLYNTKIPSHAIHWDGYTNTKSYGGTSKLKPIPEVFDGNFHTFAVCWTPDEYVFLVDGKVTARTEAEGGCNQPGYMLISTHFNENWVGKVTMQPGEHTDMIVDYVRVYSSDESYR